LQIAKKTKDVHLKLRQLAKLLGSNFPRYRGLIEHRELKNGGFFCPLGKFRECPFNKRFGSRCKFAIGKCTYCWHCLITTGWCVLLCDLYISL
jgi:hypothetical protein